MKTVEDVKAGNTSLPTYPQWFIINDLAPYFFAVLVEVFVAGFMLSSFISYIGSRAYRSDRPMLKAVAWAPVVGNIFALYITIIQLYRYFVARPLNSTGWVYPTEYKLWLLPTVIVALPVQGFFAYRASTLFRKPLAKKLCLAMFSAAILINVGLGITFTALWWHYHSEADLNPEWFAIAYCTLAAFIDTGITLVLWVLLRKQVLSRTGSTERVVVRIARLALLTSLPTAILAVIGVVFEFLATYFFQKYAAVDWFYDISKPFLVPLAPVYALMLIYSLDARNRLRISLRAGENPTTTSDSWTGESSPDEISDLPRTVTFAKTGSVPIHGPGRTVNTVGTQISMPVTAHTESSSEGDSSESSIANWNQYRSAEMVSVGDHKSTATKESGDMV